VPWSTLFKSKPRNAGTYVPQDIPLLYSGDVLVPSSDIIQAGTAVWKDYLVGFFLDKPLPYVSVVYHLKKVWKLRGEVNVKSDGFVFLFRFSSAEDRQRISEADPIIMRNKLFIIKPWDVTVGNSCRTIRSVPVWIKLFNIPLYAWSHYGINWLASRVGKFLCMDQSTERMERITFAKCLVEVSPDKELVDNFLVKLMDGTDHKVAVKYLWKPEVCVNCKEFGHAGSNCSHAVSEAKVTADEVIDTHDDRDGVNGKKRLLSTNRNQNQVWKKVNYKNNKNRDNRHEEIGKMQGDNVGAKLTQCTAPYKVGSTNDSEVTTKEKSLSIPDSNIRLVNSFQVLEDQIIGDAIDVEQVGEVNANDESMPFTVGNISLVNRYQVIEDHIDGDAIDVEQVGEDNANDEVMGVEMGVIHESSTFLTEHNNQVADSDELQVDIHVHADPSVHVHTTAESLQHVDTLNNLNGQAQLERGKVMRNQIIPSTDINFLNNNAKSIIELVCSTNVNPSDSTPSVPLHSVQTTSFSVPHNKNSSPPSLPITSPFPYVNNAIIPGWYNKEKQACDDNCHGNIDTRTRLAAKKTSKSKADSNDAQSPATRSRKNIIHQSL
jgi:hypothetical protein